MPETPDASENTKYTPKELVHLPHAFDTVAQQVRDKTKKKIPPEILINLPQLIIHPMLGVNAYAELSEGAQAFIDANEVHQGLNLNTVFGLTGADAQLEVYPSESQEYQKIKAMLNKTMRNCVDRLKNFMQEHQDTLDSKDFELTLQLCEAVINDPTEEKKYWYMMPARVSKQYRILFLEEVIIPTCLEDKFIMQVIANETEANYAHECGHMISAPELNVLRLLDNSDREEVDKVYREQFAQLGLGKKLRALMERRAPNDELTRESLAINHELVAAIAKALSPRLRDRYIRSVTARGLDENFARVIGEIVTGQPDYYGRNIIQYARNPEIYLYATDEVIGEMKAELSTVGLAHAREYLRSKHEQLITVHASTITS